MNPTLAATVERVVAAASAAKKLSEADTRAALIDPILDALGWDTRDLGAVRREVQVRGTGTTVDYALYGGDGRAALHVEAKKLGSNLDLKTASQTVNYANGAGVPWCVLTTGVRWQVFWTHARVPIDRKIVFDIDLAAEDATDAERAEALAQLDLLHRHRVEAGDLDATGAALFDTAAVNKVLDDLFTDPPDELIALVATRLDHPVADDRVQAALVRVGRPFTATPPPATVPKAPQTPGSRKQGPRRPHTYDELFAGIPQATRDLYERFDAAVMAKDPRMKRTFKAKAVNWSIGDGKGSIVVTAVPQANRLKLFLVLPGNRADGQPDLRDMTGLGHHGYGDVEAALTPANLDDRLALVDEAIAAHAARTA